MTAQAVAIDDVQIVNPDVENPPVKKERKKNPLRSFFNDEEKDQRKFVWESENGKYLWIRFPHEEVEKYLPELQQLIPLLQFHQTKIIRDAKNTEILTQEHYCANSAEHMQILLKFGKSKRFVFDGDIAMRAWASTEEGKELGKMSYAKSTSAFDLKNVIKGKARPFQVAGVAYLLKAKRTFLADEMGLGKTLQACAAAEKAGAYPMLVVCPATLKLNWEKEIKQWLPKRANSVIVADNKTIAKLYKGYKVDRKSSGKRKRKQWDVVIINYDRLERWMDHLKKIQWKAVVFDESHYLAHRSKRTKAAILMIKDLNPEYVWLLTGTPVKSYPRELIPQLQIMGRLEDFGGRANFIRRYCLLKGSVDETTAKYLDGSTRSKMIQKVHENMVQLNEQLRATCYVRREKSEVLQDLPAKTRTTLYFELDEKNQKEYQKVESDVVSWLSDRAAKDEEFLHSIRKLSKQEREFAIASRRATTEYKSARAEALVKIEYCKQVAAVGKLESVKEWTKNFLESGEHLVMFATHRNVIAELNNEFPKASTITGGDSEEARQEAVVKFQSDEKVKKADWPKGSKLILASLKAAGVGLTLTKCSNPAFIELGWTPAAHDQAEDRCHRIGQHDAVTAWYLLAKGTIEERIARLIEKKRMIVNAVADGDPMKSEAQGSIMGDLIRELTGKSML